MRRSHCRIAPTPGRIQTAYPALLPSCINECSLHVSFGNVQSACFWQNKYLESQITREIWIMIHFLKTENIDIPVASEIGHSSPIIPFATATFPSMNVKTSNSKRMHFFYFISEALARDADKKSAGADVGVHALFSQLPLRPHLRKVVHYLIQQPPTKRVPS